MPYKIKGLDLWLKLKVLQKINLLLICWFVGNVTNSHTATRLKKHHT